MKLRALALALACLAGCERGTPAASVTPAKPSAASHAVQPAKAGVTRAQVVAASGTISPALNAGAMLEAVAVTLASGAALTLAIEDDVRIEVRGPAHVALSGARRLVARDGLIAVDVAAQAVKAGQRAFSLATPAGQLEVPFAARLVVYAPSGATELASVSGELTASRAEGTLAVGGKTRVCLGALGPHPSREPGFSTVESALAGLPASHACEGEQAPEPSQLERELTETLDAFARTKDEERRLLADYARSEGAAEQGHRLRQELALRAERSIATRQRALALRAQLEAAQLGVTVEPARNALLARASELEIPAR